MKDRIKHWPSTTLGFIIICIAAAYFVYADKTTVTEAVAGIMALGGFLGLGYKPKNKTNGPT